MRRFHSLKSTHWVMWSSPLLLLVLVLTLSASSSSNPRVTGSHANPTSTIVTTSSTTTTTTLPPRVKITTTTAKAHASYLVAKVPPTTLPHANASSSVTGSNVKAVASAPAETVASGALSGQLDPSFNVADVPLEGPGTWSLATSSTANTTLQCSNRTVVVQSSFVVGAKQICQLIITTANPANTITWQLTPLP